MHYVYILKSRLYEKHYIGYTTDVFKRLKYHNKGSNYSTRKYRPYELIYLEKYLSKSEALKREKQIKSYKGGRAFKKLVDKC
jgi:putative endonuclease